MATRVLVAYATKYGSTREIAERIGRALQDAGVLANVVDARAVEDLTAYDAVILGSALYAAHWQRDANRFVNRHLGALRARPVWLFSSGPLDRSADSGTVPIAPQVAALTDPIGAREHRTFGGRLLRDTPGLDPQILETHPVGDFRDWAAIEAWATGIAHAIPLEHRIDTPDGRVLAVAEWGDPAGLPLVAIHGTPGSRLGRWRDPAIYHRAGVRRITFDRAGYGSSTRRAGRRVADVVDDVSTIADALGIDRFAVTGRSGGGPHALACAALLADRVIRCAAVVALAPFDADGLDWFAGQTPGNVSEGERALAGEAALREKLEPDRLVILERIASGRVDALPDDYQLSESDRRQQVKDRAVFDEVMIDSLRSGVDGWVDDDLAFVRPWGFDVSSITVPTSLWYGRADTLVPAAHGDWLAAHIPGVEVFAGESGHFGEDADAERELAWLTGRPPG